MYPLIDPNILDKPNDVKRMLLIISTLVRLTQTEAFKKIDAQLVPVDIEECIKLEANSEKQWLCIIRHMTTSSYHPVSSCPMGTDPSNGAVVNPKLEVHGINALRVADASIFPTNLSTHPMATCMMIGEKVSTDIVNKYNKIIQFN